MAQRLLLTITALLAICTMCHADGHVRGIVTDEKGEAMVSVVIKVYGAGNNKMLKYALSGKDRRFDIPVKDEWLPAKLTFSYIGYRLKEVTVSDTRSDNKITMTEEALSLKEVTVKSAPISSHGDTLLYNVAAFRSASDRNIEDVIRKLPGISVSENGTISYQGESINKFYIEGLDLLSGRYALATKNISPDDITSVSIYENHQPKKVLKDISFSEKAALNLKLKNNRMLKPTGTVTAGAGYGDNVLWKGELYGMIIGTGSQHLVTVKTNNDGTAYGNETRMLTAGGTSYTETAAWNIFPQNPFGSASVPKERYYNNKSVSTSVNSLFKTGENTTLTLNADYQKDRNSYYNSKFTAYSTGEGEYVTVDEGNNSMTDAQEANLYLNIENNGEKLYMAERLSMRGRFRRNRYDLSGKGLPTEVQRTNDFGISNSMNGIIRKNDRVWQFSSDISFANTPLNFIRATMPGQQTATVYQNAEGLNFHTHEKTSFSWIVSSRSDLSLNVSFKSDYDRLNSIQTVPGNNAGNDNCGYKLVSTAEPAYQYNSSRLRLTFSLPVEMYNVSYKDLISQSRFILNKPFVGLRATARYRPHGHTDINISVGKSTSTGGINDFIINPIYTTYRTATTLGTGVLSVHNTLYATAGINYRNSLDGTFATLHGNYRHTQSNILRSSNVTEDKTVTDILNQTNTAHLWNIYSYAAKNFSAADMVLSLTGNITSTKRNVVRQGIGYGVTNSNYDIELSAVNRFFGDAVSTSLSCKYMLSVQDMGIINTKNKINSLTGSMKMSVFPIKTLEIYFSPYYSMTKQHGTAAISNLYVDGGTRWTGKAIEIELALKNITNRKEYTIRTFRENDIYSYSYRLRPAEAVITLKLKF